MWKGGSVENIEEETERMWRGGSAEDVEERKQRGGCGVEDIAKVTTHQQFPDQQCLKLNLKSI